MQELSSSLQQLPAAPETAHPQGSEEEKQEIYSQVRNSQALQEQTQQQAGIMPGSVSSSSISPLLPPPSIPQTQQQSSFQLAGSQGFVYEIIEEEIIHQEVRFANPHVVDLLEYRQFEDSPLSVNIAHHVPPPHDPDFVPWYDQDYQELPWFEQPDLEEDDNLTKLCKRVLVASENYDENLQLLEQRAGRVESNVIKFALKLQNRRALRMQLEQQMEAPRPPPPPPIPKPTELTPSKSISSLVSGPESVFDSDESHETSSISQKRNNPQDVYRTQPRTPSRRNLPPQKAAYRQSSVHSLTVDQLTRMPAVSSSYNQGSSQRLTWSFVDSGAIPKGIRNNSISRSQQLNWSQPALQASQTLQLTTTAQPKIVPARSQMHSSAVMGRSLNQSSPPPRWSVVDSGRKIPKTAALAPPPTPPLAPAPFTTSIPLKPPQEIPEYAQLWQQQQQLPQGHSPRHSSAVTPSRQRQQQPPPTHSAHTLPIRPRASGLSERQSPQVVLASMHEHDSPYRSELDRRRIDEHVTSSRSSMPKIKSSLLHGIDDTSKSVHSVPFDEDPAYAFEFFQDELYFDTVKQRGKKRTKPSKSSGSTRSIDPPAAVASATTKRRVQTPKQQQALEELERPRRELMVSNVMIPNHSRLERTLSNVSEISEVDFGAINASQAEMIKGTPAFPPPELHEKIRQAQLEQRRLNVTHTPIPDFAKADIESLEKQWKAYSARASRTKSNLTLKEDERQQQASTTRACSWQTTMGGVCVIFWLVAIWATVMVAYFTNRNVAPSSKAPVVAPATSVTAAPSPSPGESLTPRLDGETLLPGWSWDVIQRDGDSPQWKAWEWMQMSRTEEYSNERLIQRYAIATFYYATRPNYDAGGVPTRWLQSGDNSTIESEATDQGDADGWLDPDTSECTWYDGIACNANEVVDFFTFQSSNLHGSVPAEMGLLSKLLSFDLGANPTLRGTIPTQLGLVTDLVGLDLHACDLTGAIPTELGLMTNLLWMTLASQGGTGLSSTIPTELALMTKLQHLRLQENQLTGQIPPILSNMVSLLTLVLRQNLLTGYVPVELSGLVQLQGLALDSNHLGTGGIPDEFGRMTSLIELHLSSNQLQGYLPATLNQLSDSLTILALSGNQLVGPLPAVWEQLSKLQVLRLENNAELTGTIPLEWGIQWPYLKQIFLHGTKLVGEVPVGLCFLKDDPEYSLETIGISCNAVNCTCGCTCL
jgi:Leucine rich repeat